MWHSDLSFTERQTLDAVGWAHSREAAVQQPGRGRRVWRWAATLLGLLDRGGEYFMVVDDEGNVVAVTSQ